MKTVKQQIYYSNQYDKAGLGNLLGINNVVGPKWK